VSSASSPTPPTRPSGRDAGVEDATRRTRLANERTYLAWWRTGATLLGLAIAVGRIAPDIANAKNWPYEAVGACFGIVGLAFILVGYRRAKTIEAALDEGRFAPLDATLTLWLSVAGFVLGLATVALVLFVH
jgi:inner membrane protein YidH